MFQNKNPEPLQERFERLYASEGVPVGGPLSEPPDFSKMTDNVTYIDEAIRSAFYFFKLNIEKNLHLNRFR